MELTHQSNEFWSWFVTVADELAKDFEDESLLAQLNQRIAAFGLAWELGPGENGLNVLALSPDGDLDLLPRSKQLAQLAPPIAGWRILGARPTRQSPLEFSIETNSGEVTPIDARAWRYVLYRYPDSKHDIVVEQPNLGDLTDDDRYTAAVLCIDGLIGEELRLSFIVGIEPVLALDSTQAPRATPILHLRDHIQKLTSVDRSRRRADMPEDE